MMAAIAEYLFYAEKRAQQDSNPRPAARQF
jgi:hypothetical protein